MRLVSWRRGLLGLGGGGGGGVGLLRSPGLCQQIGWPFAGFANRLGRLKVVSWLTAFVD